jgi:hypothetical protein
LLAISFVVGTLGISAGGPLPAGVAAAPTDAVVTYPPGPCDTSDVLALIGKGGPLATSPKSADAMIRGRIASCNEIIAKYLAGLPTAAPTPAAVAHNIAGLPSLPPFPAPPPAPTPPPNCAPSSSGDPLRQFQVLAYCTGWVTRNVTAPVAAPTVTAAPVVFHTPSTVAGKWTKAVYVLALASDAPTSAQIALQVADDLRDERFRFAAPHPAPTDPYTGRDVDYEVLAEPTWTLAQYQQQCLVDSSTAGAIVVLQPGSQSSSYNLLFSASWTALTLQAIVVDCEPTNTAYVNNSAFITWMTHVRTGTGRRYSVSLSTMLGILAGVLAVHPTRSTTYTVAPPSPLPPGTTYQSGYTTGTNQGVGVVAAAGVAGLTPLASTNVGQGPGPDAQTAGAMARVLPELLRDILKPCGKEGLRDPAALPFTPLEPFATQCRWFAKPANW